MENRIAYLRPEQIRSRLSKLPLIILPVGPLEWHGPHLPYGTDALNAEHVATDVARRAGALLWPTLFWGTERERSPEVARNLGFKENQFIVGMDFPKVTVPSSYCPEEIFAVVVRESLREIQAVGARLVVIVNGHGAVNHNQVLQRLAKEYTATTDLRVHVRIAFPMDMVQAGSIGHATSDETSLLMAFTRSVDTGALPKTRRPLRYADFAIVDGPGFDGRGPADKTVPDQDDPRRASSPARGKGLHKRIVNEIIKEVRALLKECK